MSSHLKNMSPGRPQTDIQYISADLSHSELKQILSSGEPKQLATLRELDLKLGGKISSQVQEILPQLVVSKLARLPERTACLNDQSRKEALAKIQVIRCVIECFHPHVCWSNFAYAKSCLERAERFMERDSLFLRDT